MKKTFIVIVSINFYLFKAYSQQGIMLNPYLDYTQNQPVDPNNYPPYYENLNSWKIFSTYHPPLIFYSGEYEICIKDLFWHNDFPGSDITFDIETIGFPFMLNCFDDQLNVCPDCNSSVRNLVMPDNNHAYNPATNTWGDFLYRISEGEFDGNDISVIDKNGTPFHQTLASYYFNKGTPFLTSTERNILPHTVHKINLYLHCGPSNGNNDIISKLSFIYDNTRGRMRFYPFYTDNCAANQSSYHDVIFRPYLAVNTDPNTASQVMLYNDSESNADWTDNTGTINYYTLGEIDNNGCSYTIPAANDPFYDNTFTSYDNPYPGPAYLFSCYLFQDRGTTLAGYDDPISAANPLAYVNTMQDKAICLHHYKIDQDIDLTILNPDEKIIYNPSEVDVTTTDLHFPSNYTFKTIRGTHPTVSDVDADNNDPQSGPIPHSDLRQVPVRTDLRYDGTTYPHDPAIAQNSVYASVYYLKNNSMLTIDNCVKIFDATFVAEAGGTLAFADHSQILGFETDIFRYS